MASEVSISNLALSHIGDRATVSSIDPPEGSAQAEHCAMFYQIARDEVLNDHAWSFCTMRGELAAESVAVEGFDYAYVLPSDVLVVREVMPAGYSEINRAQGQSIPFEVETHPTTGNTVVLTNQPNAIIRWSSKVTTVARFSPMFISALSRLLATYLAGAIIKGPRGVQIGEGQYRLYLAQLARAKEIDANQGTQSSDFQPAAMAARGLALSYRNWRDRAGVLPIEPTVGPS